MGLTVVQVNWDSFKCGQLQIEVMHETAHTCLNDAWWILWMDVMVFLWNEQSSNTD